MVQIPGLAKRKHRTRDGDQPSDAVQKALARLLLCNQIRELTRYQMAVTTKDLSRTHGLLAGVFRLACGLGGLSGPGYSAWRGILIGLPFIGVLRLWLYRRSVWRAVGGTARTVFRRIGSDEAPSSEITGYVTSTQKEGPLVRVCMMLRAMRRYGVCIELLIDRLNSGLPSTETRQWLAFFLREIGDGEAAAMIDSTGGRREASQRGRDSRLRELPSSNGSQSQGIRYGVVIPTMFDSDVFRSSLLSLLSSDFRGEIVVAEEGNQPDRVCEPFCSQLPVKYLKNPSWTGHAGLLNLAIERLAPDTDIVIYAHSDVLWPPRWFGQLNDAWETVHGLDKVDIINLGYLDFRADVEPALTELFVNGRYEELVWVLRQMRNVGHLLEFVQDIQVQHQGRMFGLARHPYNDSSADLQTSMAGSGVAGSFLVRAWRELGGFDPGMPHGIHFELQCNALRGHKWNLWIDNTPLIHLRGSDTGRLRGSDKRKFVEDGAATYKTFVEKYGWKVEHFLQTYLAETCVIHHDEIVTAANELRFSDIDFVFDDNLERLKHKTLSTCELYECPQRSTCIYV